jgi:hypothetical protein
MVFRDAHPGDKRSYEFTFSRCVLEFVCFALRRPFLPMRNVSAEPTTMPHSKHRKKLIARDAWKCQKRKEIETGAAFCTEKRATIKTMIMAITRLIIFLPPQFPLYLQ